MTRYIILSDPPVTVQIDRRVCVNRWGDAAGRTPDQVKAILRTHFGRKES